MSSKNEMARREMLLATGAGVGLLGLISAAEALAAPDAQGKKPLVFHHIGIPTDKKRDKERLLADSKVYITDPADDPFRVEWCRWLPGSPAAEKLQKYPHIAFQVDDVEAEIAKYDPAKVFAKPFVPFEGVKVAFIDHDGFLVEFLQVTK